MTGRLSSPRLDAPALYEVIREVRRLFHRLANATDRLHADLEVSVAQRALLEALADGGASPVPELARGKGVSRQHVQVLANELLAAGLVEARPNPAHLRSPLLELTAAGRHRFTTMRGREVHLLEAAVARLARPELGRLAGALREIGDAVEASLADRPAAPTRRHGPPRASRRPARRT